MNKRHDLELEIIHDLQENICDYDYAIDVGPSVTLQEDVLLSDIVEFIADKIEKKLKETSHE